MPWWAAFLVASTDLRFGIGLERVAYKPLRESPRISIRNQRYRAPFQIENWPSSSSMPAPGLRRAELFSTA
jgi:branched-chain amino acid transport system permease protein